MSQPVIKEERKLEYVIIIPEYLPEFNDGRIKRIHSLENYFEEKDISYVVLSHGIVTERPNNVKFGYGLLKFKKTDSEEKKIVKRNKKYLHFLKKIFTPFLIVDYLFISSFAFIRKLNKLLSKNKDCTVIVSVPRFSILLSLLFFNFRKRKLIIDFRDLPFTHSMVPNKLSAAMIYGAINVLQRRAKQIWVTTEEAACEYLRIMKCKCPVLVVPNGYDYKPNIDDDRKFDYRIGYFGNIGGPRTIKRFDKSIKKIEKDIHFWGRLDQNSKDRFGHRYHGILTGDDLYNTMSKCEFFLLIINEEEDAKCAIPGKLYEYILFKRPILYCGPQESATITLLRQLNYPYINISEDVILHSSNYQCPDLEGVFQRDKIWDKTFKSD